MEIKATVVTQILATIKTEYEKSRSYNFDSSKSNSLIRTIMA